MAKTVRDTIKDITRHHLTAENGLAFGQCLTAAGWVGVQTYVDSGGNLRVKKEVLCAMSGISTGNTPSYPNIEDAN